jgi:hypothetical protein
MTEIPTSLLSWNGSKRKFTGELSTVTRGGGTPLTSLIRLRNPKTNGTREFSLTLTERDAENDVVAFHFTSTGRTARGTLTLTLFND